MPFAWKQIGETEIGDNQYDNYGFFTALNDDGTLVAVSAYGDEIIDVDNVVVANRLGYVRVLENDGNNLKWQQIGDDILDPRPEPNNNYGGTIAFSRDGTTLAISSRCSDVPSGNTVIERAGVVRVYRRVVNQWIQIGGDIEGTEANKCFGTATSLNYDGTILAIGEGNSIGPKFIRVYQYDGTNWNLLGSPTTVNQGTSPNTFFAPIPIKLSDDGQRFSLGYDAFTNPEIYEGAAFVYEFDGSSTWTEIFRYESNSQGGVTGSWSGLSGDGKHLITDTQSSERVLTFIEVSGVWSQYGNDIMTDVIDPTQVNFGARVDITPDGNTIAIASRGFPDTRIGAYDCVKIFDYDGLNDRWLQRGEDITRVALSADFVRMSLSYDGQKISIGDPAERVGSSISNGSFRVFEWTDRTTPLEQKNSNRYWTSVLAGGC